jgi:hypothetical protein
VLDLILGNGNAGKVRDAANGSGVNGHGRLSLKSPGLIADPFCGAMR